MNAENKVVTIYKMHPVTRQSADVMSEEEQFKFGARAKQEFKEMVEAGAVFYWCNWFDLTGKWSRVELHNFEFAMVQSGVKVKTA